MKMRLCPKCKQKILYYTEFWDCCIEFEADMITGLPKIDKTGNTRPGTLNPSNPKKVPTAICVRRVKAVNGSSSNLPTHLVWTSSLFAMTAFICTACSTAWCGWMNIFGCRMFASTIGGMDCWSSIAGISFSRSMISRHLIGQDVTQIGWNPCSSSSIQKSHFVITPSDGSNWGAP